MDKVNKYIEDYTKTCSNESIFESKGDNKLYHSWLTVYNAQSVALIAREETIEDVYKWLRNNLGKYAETDAAGNIYFSDFEDDLKQAMKE